MRIGIVIVGVILCIIGFALVVGGYVYTSQNVSNAANRAISNQNSCDPNSPNYEQCMMQNAQQTLQSANNAAQIGTILTYVGVFSGFVGFVLIVVGAVLPGRKGVKKEAAAETVPKKGEEKEEPEENEDAALTTLKVRYAKGEITKAQYDKIRKDLEE